MPSSFEPQTNITRRSIAGCWNATNGFTASPTHLIAWGDIYLVGHLPLHAVTDDELDRVFGSILRTPMARSTTCLNWVSRPPFAENGHGGCRVERTLETCSFPASGRSRGTCRVRRNDRFGQYGRLTRMTDATGTLILLRHGQSTWNESNQFTGWVDVALTEQGISEAKAGGQLLVDAGLPDVLHTSLLTRAITTANLALAEADRGWIPVRRIRGG